MICVTKKLADWFGIQTGKFVSGRTEDVSKQKTPQQRADGSKETQPAKNYPDHSKSSDSVKYMQEVEAWFDE
jgi:hypothetical protein